MMNADAAIAPPSGSDRRTAAAPAGSPAADAATTRRQCRFCSAPLTHSIVDLGAQPLANSLLSAAQLAEPETTWPLHAFVCDSCMLVQIDATEAPERIFGGDYAYFASYSQSWLDHAAAYVDQAVDRLGLDGSSRVIEVASNDGYLLQNFIRRGIPAFGIEPAANVARAAIAKGIPTRICFLNGTTARQLASEGRTADLLIGNNVLAHVPSLNDFVGALRMVLKPGGTLTMEFPHLQCLIEQAQFDTIYHEHFSYFSLLAVRRIFAAHRLDIFDVERLSTHGGSLRIYAARSDRGTRPSAQVEAVLEQERLAGLDGGQVYDRFAERARQVKRQLVRFLIEAKEAGKSVVGYGAAAKGSTLLNYCGIRTDFLDYVVDASPRKQGNYLPGSRIPIMAPEHLRETRPDYVLILPWNLKDEIIAQHGYIRDWNGRFLVPVPEPVVIA